jgi:hypothetical protein
VKKKYGKLRNNTKHDAGTTASASILSKINLNEEKKTEKIAFFGMFSRRTLANSAMRSQQATQHTNHRLRSTQTTTHTHKQSNSSIAAAQFCLLRQQHTNNGTHTPHAHTAQTQATNTATQSKRGPITC